MWTANTCAVVAQHTSGSHQLIDIHNFYPLNENTRYVAMCLHITHVCKARLDTLKRKPFQRCFLISITGLLV